jgi:peptidoglycan hydrolase FlgJ
MTIPASTPVAPFPLERLGALRQGSPLATKAKDEAAAKQAAQDFEAFFITHAFEDMFAGLSSDPLFGGGEGEDIFKSFLLNEYGKTVAKAGGIGISDMVQRQLLQLQESA